MAASQSGSGETREYETKSSREKDMEVNIEDTSKCSEDDSEDIKTSINNVAVNKPDNAGRSRLRRSLFPKVN